MATNTFGILPGETVGFLKRAARFFIVAAMAGVGLSTNLSKMRNTGFRASCVGLGAAVVMGGVSLALIDIWGLE
ncbi:MAG: putative sulfate exporter family transporter [Bacillota bacterium]